MSAEMITKIGMVSFRRLAEIHSAVLFAEAAVAGKIAKLALAYSLSNKLQTSIIAGLQFGNL